MKPGLSTTSPTGYPTSNGFPGVSAHPWRTSLSTDETVVDTPYLRHFWGSTTFSKCLSHSLTWHKSSRLDISASLRAELLLPHAPSTPIRLNSLQFQKGPTQVNHSNSGAHNSFWWEVAFCWDNSYLSAFQNSTPCYFLSHDYVPKCALEAFHIYIISLLLKTKVWSMFLLTPFYPRRN